MLRSATTDAGGERHDGEREQHRDHDDGRREHEDGPVGEGRDPVLLGEDLDRVGQRPAAGRTGRRGWGRSGPGQKPSRRRSNQIRPGAMTMATANTASAERMLRAPPAAHRRRCRTAGSAIAGLRRGTCGRRVRAGPAGRATATMPAPQGSARGGWPGRPTARPATPQGSEGSTRSARSRVTPPARRCTRSGRAPQPRGVGVAERHVGLRHQRADGRSQGAQLLRAEDVVQGHDEPVVALRGRRRAAPLPAPAGPALRRPPARPDGTPVSPPRSGPPTSSWNLLSAWIEFQPRRPEVGRQRPPAAARS